jgi:hypothetical protein
MRPMTGRLEILALPLTDNAFSIANKPCSSRLPGALAGLAR